MKLNKKFILVLSVAYFFFSLGISNYALCMGLCNKNENAKRVIRCVCCAHKEKHCKCLKNPKSPYTSNTQSINYVNYISDIQNIRNQVNLIFDSIILKDIDHSEIQPKQILISNKNLEMLRTVILLN